MQEQVWRKFHGLIRKCEDRMTIGTEKENEGI